MFNKIIQKIKTYFRKKAEKKAEKKRQKGYVDFISRSCKTHSGQLLSGSEIEQYKPDLLVLCSSHTNDEDLKSAIFEHFGKNIRPNQLQALKILAKQKQFQQNQ